MHSINEQTCRLCFLPGYNNINIFKNSELDVNIAEVIRQHFQCEVGESDCFPNAVCRDCWMKTKSFHTFYKHVTSAREHFIKNYLRDYVKDEHSLFGTFNDITGEYVPNIEDDSKFASTDKNLNASLYLIEATNEKDIEQVLFSDSHIKIEEQFYDEDDSSSVDKSDITLGKAIDVSSGTLTHIKQVNSAAKQQILDKHFDMACDHCDSHFETLENAQIHYKNKHDIAKGYIKCCNRKLNHRKLVNDHILYHLNPDIFKCNICERACSTRQLLLSHKYGHRASELRKYICDICGKDFGLKHQITQHIINVHALKQMFNCNRCASSFTSERNLITHVSLSHELDLKSESDIHNEIIVTPEQREQMIAERFDMSCGVCQETMESLEEVQNHYLEQHDNPDGYIKCCNMTMKIKYRKFIDDHIAWHLDPRYFTCKVCDKSFMLRRALSLHMKRHTAIAKKWFVCDGCERIFSRESYLHDHVKKCVRSSVKRKNPARLVKCTFCSKGFVNKEKLTAHVKIIHAPEMEAKRKSMQEKKIISEYFDMMCDICNASFDSLYRAKIHYKTEHNIDGYLKCCGLKFNKKDLVNDHVQWHLNPDIFKCITCGEQMKTRVKMYCHTRTHLEGPQFTCDICQKCFNTKELVKRHLLKVHIAKHMKPSFGCHNCEKSFRTKGDLAVHIQLSHNAHDSDIDNYDVSLISTTVTAEESARIIAENFDMSCDVCEIQLETFKEAQSHYLTEHKIRCGYIKCCNFKFKQQWNMQDHIAWHLNPEIFKCKLCQQNLGTRMTLKSHIASHKALESEKYVCRVCNKLFKRLENMKKHVKSIHPGTKVELDFKFTKKRGRRSDDSIAYFGNMRDTENDQQNYKFDDAEVPIPEYFDKICDLCSATLGTLEQAKQHYLHEHSIAKGYIKCCNTKLKQRGEVLDHIAWHSNPESFKCTVCHKCFKSKLTLRHHLITHGDKHKCKVCGKCFSCNEKLKIHQITHQKMEPTFQCSECNKKYPTAAYLKLHVNRIHRPGNPQICEICAKVCKSKELLRSHLQTHSKQPKEMREKIQCDTCGAWLASRNGLKAHMLIHTSGVHKCDQCGKIAQGLNALQSHIRTVHIDANHKCHLCDKSFKLPSALKDHVATHTGEKLYKCLYCPESFIWRPNCYSHQKKVHLREWTEDQAKKAIGKSSSK